MIKLRSIQSLTDFKRNTNDYIKELQRSHDPLVLTVNGKAELVVLDPDAFQEIVDRIEYADSVIDIKEGMNSFGRGEGKRAADGLAEIAAKHGISR